MTHDLGYLVTLVDGIEGLPASVSGSRWLTPWAGGWRYETEGSPIDRALTVGVAEAAFDWSRSLVAGRSIGSKAMPFNTVRENARR